MKYFVKIKEGSLIENERAGATMSTYYMGTSKEVFFEVYGLSNIDVEKVLDGKIYVYIYNSIRGGGMKASGIVVKQPLPDDEEVIMLLREKVNAIKIRIDVKRDVKTVQHSPIPKYDYEYENTKIECFVCKMDIMTDEIISDYDDDIYRENICPNCNNSDCCELEYEKLDDFLERTKQLNKV